MAKVISRTVEPPRIENVYCTMNKSGKLGGLYTFWVGSRSKVWPMLLECQVSQPLGVRVRSGCKAAMVMLSAMLAASVLVNPITRAVTLGRGLAADRALLMGLVALSVEFVYQPEVSSQGLKLRFGNPVRSV